MKLRHDRAVREFTIVSVGLAVVFDDACVVVVVRVAAAVVAHEVNGADYDVVVDGASDLDVIVCVSIVIVTMLVITMRHSGINRGMHRVFSIVVTSQQQRRSLASGSIDNREQT